MASDQWKRDVKVAKLEGIIDEEFGNKKSSEEADINQIN